MYINKDEPLEQFVIEFICEDNGVRHRYRNRILEVKQGDTWISTDGWTRRQLEEWLKLIGR